MTIREEISHIIDDDVKCPKCKTPFNHCGDCWADQIIAVLIMRGYGRVVKGGLTIYRPNSIEVRDSFQPIGRGDGSNVIE